jgi:phage gpG-like protein
MEIKVRVRGVDHVVRDLAQVSEVTKDAAIRGVLKAAEHLRDKVKAKFGVYQPTGGRPAGRGPWPKLKFETIQRKLRKYGVGNKPLIASGKMRDSIEVVKGGAGRISASVGSDDPVLIHHVYGAPKAGVPQRDPIRVTAVEEKDVCSDIIKDEIYNSIGRV